MKRFAAITLLVVLTGFIATPLFSEPLPGFPLDSADVNAFDRALMQPYNGLLDDTATIVELGMLAAPAAFLFVPGADWFNDGLMYAETGLFSFGVRTLLKKAISRPRPCMYYDSYPAEMTEDDDWNESFPSGHTLMCFSTASFITYMFNTRYPDSEWKVPAIACAYGIAAVTGSMRVISGNHFPTDVLTGAAVGTAAGFLIPWAHDTIREFIDTNWNSKGNASVSTVMTPDTLGFSIHF